MNHKVLALFALLSSLFFSCRQDMHDQAKYEPLERSSFFGDGRSSRPLVEDTVARGELRENTALYTGKVDNKLVDKFPVEITDDFMERGRQRFTIFCAPCHDLTGSGQGMVVRRGYRRPPSFHIDRLRQASVGYLFDVLTNGFGVMPSYAEQIPVQDRWAIAAYVRALQFSQHASLDDVPDEERKNLGSAGILPADKSEMRAGSPRYGQQP